MEVRARVVESVLVVSKESHRSWSTSGRQSELFVFCASSLLSARKILWKTYQVFLSTQVRTVAQTGELPPSDVPLIVIADTEGQLKAAQTTEKVCP